jgi:dTDP-4-amino-4,6-dideoxygalactose transaminase
LRIVNADRDSLVKYLNEHDIPCGVYYPVPLHSQKAYADVGVKEENFPVTNQLVKEVISLPMHSELDTDQIKYISDKVLRFLDQKN